MYNYLLQTSWFVQNLFDEISDQRFTQEIFDFLMFFGCFVFYCIFRNLQDSKVEGFEMSETSCRYRIMSYV